MIRRGDVRGGAVASARLGLLPCLLLAGTAAIAQDLHDRPVAPPATNAGLQPTDADDQVSFAADALDYDQDSDIVTATGDVRMLRSGSRLRADKVVWNRKTGEVRASGSVAVVRPGGDTAYGDDVVLQDDMKDGIVENALLVLADGGRLAARHGERKGDVTVLDHAAYTPCPVTDGGNCAHEPSWKITALRITYNEGKHRIYYKDARLSLFGKSILWLPSFSHPDGNSEQGGGGGGLLLPNVQFSKATGLEYAQPYYLQLAPNRDLTITPHLYTAILPAIEAKYRSLDSHGAFQVRGDITYGSRLPALLNTTGLDADRGVRGFIDANGTYQFGPNWTVSGQLRLETDRTFMKRYDISNDDRLRSSLNAERIDDKSYLSIAGWFVQTVRAGDSQGQQPIALPAIDYRRRIVDPWLGGVAYLEANSLSLIRTSGQDTQRVFAGARWDLRKLTRMGQELVLTAYARGDLYHTDDAAKTSTLIYQGTDGWHGRGIVALAADARWPFIGPLMGGSQQLVPRVQLVATPSVSNTEIPNEDSRAVDLEDTNLFAINRFSGYDRWEDSSRITYGLEWNYQRPKLDVSTTIGQSYRLDRKPSILPPGTGLSDRFSDYVGRITIKYGSFIRLTERFRLDKDNLAIRRNEADLMVGGQRTYALIGYLRLNRNIDPAIEDLRDREELRLGGRLQLTRFISIFGSTVIDLTTAQEDPLTTSDGFADVRDRVGVTYEDDCISIAIQWRRDTDPTGDARRGSTVSLRLALKNIGR